MQAISSASSLPLEAGLYLPTSASRSSDLTRLKASSETHTDVSVVTAAGDRITLSAESLFRASSVALNYHSTDQGSSLDLHRTASAAQIRNSIELSVQGQLDPQEEADIGQLIEKLAKVVSNFLGGDIKGAISKALKIGDLGTVASFQLNVQKSEEIAISQEQHSPFSPESQVNTPSLANQLAAGIREATIDSNKLLKHLPQVLRQLFDSLDTQVSEQELRELFFDIETWLPGKPQALEPATEPLATPA
jgi:hypothetical protein